MENSSRRKLMMASASIFALIGIASSSSRGDLFVPTDLENSKKPMIPFGSARGLVDSLVKEELGRSEKEFGTRYSPDEAKSIRDRIWESTQLVMLKYYVPKETP